MLQLISLLQTSNLLYFQILFYKQLLNHHNALTEAPNATTTECSLKFHSIRTPEHPMAVKPTLHEFALVPVEM